MSEPSLNPYAAPAVVSPRGTPGFRGLFRRTVSDIRWGDPPAALRTGLRLLLVATCLNWVLFRISEVYALTVAFGGTAPVRIPYWTSLAAVSFAAAGIMVLGMILLLRGTPTARRWLGVACLCAWSLPWAVRLVRWLSSNPMFANSIPSPVWTIARYAFVALLLIWLRSLARHESTKRLAAIALAMRTCMEGMSLLSLLLFTLRPQAAPTGPMWLAIAWTLVVAAVACLTPIVIARVLGESAAGLERHDESPVGL